MSTLYWRILNVLIGMDVIWLHDSDKVRYKVQARYYVICSVENKDILF